MTVNIHEAKTQLSKLIARVEAGEEIVIARAGKPAVRLVKIEESPPPLKRELGRWKGKIWIADDFDEAPVPGFEEFYR